MQQQGKGDQQQPYMDADGGGHEQGVAQGGVDNEGRQKQFLADIGNQFRYVEGKDADDQVADVLE